MATNPLAALYGDIYAPLYFCALISTGLYGITCMQTFFYYIHYPNDSRRMKCFVAALWVLDTVHEALTVVGVYKYIVAGLVNQLGILDENLELVLQQLSETLVSAPVQAFFVYRVYIFSGRNIVAPILWAIQEIYQFVAAILYVAKAFYSVNGSVRVVGVFVLADNFFTNLSTSSIALAVAVDVLIATAMVYLLVRKRSISGLANTTHILQRLIVFAVNTGVWTATFAVLTLILASVVHFRQTVQLAFLLSGLTHSSQLRAFPTKLLFVVFGIPLSSIYCNTLLANLNARTYIRGEATTQNGGSDVVWMSQPLFDDVRADKQSGEAKSILPTHNGIRRTTEVVTFADADRSATAKTNV